MAKKAEESNVLKTENGLSITPYLHTSLSKKEGGHHVQIRVTILSSKQHVYLPTGIYTMPKGFDSVTKGLKKPEQQLNLRTKLAEVRYATEILKGDITTDAVRDTYNYYKKGDEMHDWLILCADLAENASLDSLLEKRKQLEDYRADIDTQLVTIGEMIAQLAVSTKRSVLKTKPSTQAVDEYQSAKKLFLASLVGRGERDKQAFNSFFKVLDECAVAKKFKLSLDVFDMTFYGVYADFILYDRDNYNNTFGAHVKKLKAFLKYSESKGFKVNQGYKDKEFKILEETKKVVYLDAEEIDMLWNLRDVFPQNRNHIDLCVFQNLTGLRVGDCMQKHYIVREEGKRFLSSTTQKTEGTYYIPLTLDDRIEQILELHTGNMKILSEAVYNRDIKNVLKKMYAHYGKPDITIEYKRYKLTKAVTFEELKSDMIASHSARRGFVSRNINSGHFTESDLLEILGSKDYTQLKKYIKIKAKALSDKAERSKQQTMHVD